MGLRPLVSTDTSSTRLRRRLWLFFISIRSLDSIRRGCRSLERSYGLEDVSRYPALLEELASRGYSDEDLKKIAGRSVLRVMREGERTRTRLNRTLAIKGDDRGAGHGVNRRRNQGLPAPSPDPIY